MTKNLMIQSGKQLVSMEFDIRTREDKAEDKRYDERARQWFFVGVTMGDNREETYEEIWSEPT